MDFHKMEGITLDEVKQAHVADESIQDKFHVKYHQFWVNENEGHVFCLMEGPDKESCEAVHRAAHGNVACAMTQVATGFVDLFMGKTKTVLGGHVMNLDGTLDLGSRHLLTIRNVEVPEGSTFSKQIHTIIEEAGGRIHVPEDQGIVGIFERPQAALHCIYKVQQLTDRHHSLKYGFQMGLAGGQPVAANGDFFDLAIRTSCQLSLAAPCDAALVSSYTRKALGWSSEKKFPTAAGLRFMDGAEEELIDRVLTVIHAHLGDDTFSVRNMVKAVGMSQPQLYRKLMSICGQSPLVLLRNVRLDRAVGLLKQKTRNVSQIGYEVGYSNPSHFSQIFKDRFGIAPSQMMEATA